jgi:hypothetical protein
MALRLILMVALVVLFIFFVVMWFVSTAQATREKRAIRQAKQSAHWWSESKKVSDLITLHTRMVFKHGPDSEEAKTFRFGVESRELMDDKASLKAFNEVADLIENNARKVRRA